MRINLSYILFFLVIMMVANHLVIGNQNTKIRNIEDEIKTISNEIDQLKIDFSYITRPQNLKNINNEEFQLVPILQDDIMNLN